MFDIFIRKFKKEPKGLVIGRNKFSDEALQFRMRAGFPGDVNRSHPASIEPVMQHASTPPLGFGLAAIGDPTTNTVRGALAGDTAIVTVDGITVRPYPFQPSTASGYGAVPFNNNPPLPPGALDILKRGYILTKLSGTGTPGKYSPAFLWVAASSGAHIQGGFEVAATGGSTAAITNVVFNGPPDANGICEVIIRD